MHFFVCDLRVVDPLFSIVLKKGFEEGSDSWVLHHFLHRNVVVLVPTFNLLEHFHCETPFITELVRMIVHEIRESLAKVFGNVFGVSFSIAVP